MNAKIENIAIDTVDGGSLETDIYPGGAHAVCLFHGKRFDKNVWRDFAGALQARDYTVVAPNFRGYGASRPGSTGDEQHGLDVVATLAYAQRRVGRVSALGASMAGPALLEGLCLAERAVAHVILLSPAWEPGSGYDCLRGKAQGALLWYGDREPYAEACAAIGAHLPFPVVTNIQASALHAHAYLADAAFAPRLTDAILERLGAQATAGSSSAST